MKPRLLLVARTRHAFPLPEPERRRWDALAAELDVRVLGSGRQPDDARFRLYPDPPVAAGAFFYALLPLRIASALRDFHPDAVIAQGAQETAAALLGRRLARSRAKVILDLHGDWRAPTRLYGSRPRRLLAPLADALGSWAFRHADGIRSITPYTTELVRGRGREPLDEFPAFMDLSAFAAPSKTLPETPRVLFVGVLERYKNVDGLVRAWHGVPVGELHVVGSGTLAPLVCELVREQPGRVRWDEQLEPAQVAAALDDAWLLVLPSRSEGMGRVVVEAFCRGRAVVGSRVGGIPGLVEHGRNGLLVPPEDEQALAGALVKLLSTRDEAERLGAGAAESAQTHAVTPEQYAARLRQLIERVAPQAAS